VTVCVLSHERDSNELSLSRSLRALFNKLHVHACPCPSVPLKDSPWGSTSDPRSGGLRWDQPCSLQAADCLRYRADDHLPVAPAAARWRQNSRTDDGQMIKGLTATIGDQALDLVLHS